MAGGALTVPAVTSTLAFAARVREVLLAIALTVPMNCPSDDLTSTDPTANSERNKVEVPVTVALAVEAVKVPVKFPSSRIRFPFTVLDTLPDAVAALENTTTPLVALGLEPASVMFCTVLF